MLNQNSLKWILQLNWCKGEEIYKFGSTCSSTVYSWFLIIWHKQKCQSPLNAFDKYLFISPFINLIFIFSFVLFYHLPCFIHINIIHYIENCKKKIYAEHYDNFHSLIEEIIHVSKTMLVCDATIMNPLLWHCYLNTSIIPFSSG